MAKFSVWALFAAGLLSASSASAEDYFLTIGGGYSPTGNQISLEKNVGFFQRLLAESYPDGAPHDIYFADGDNSDRDLQFHDPDAKTPRVQELLARVLGQTKYLEYQYRNHAVSPSRGGSSRDNIKRWFAEEGKKLKPRDRLFLYVTAHGGRSTDKKRPGNTKLYLWNRQNILVSELVGHLDTLPQGVSTTMVMVQCYSGGFANVLFNGGDPGKPVSNHDRCGFYATVENRVAAGCTPDINEENYREYSSYFWAALLGQTRTGKKIDRPDYNHDGVVSLAEAHAFSLITSTTIDISVKTSDAFLRKFSKLFDPKAATPKEDTPPEPELYGPNSSYAALLSLASPEEKAVLEALSTELKLKTDLREAETKKLIAALGAAKKKIDAELKKKKTEKAQASAAIKTGLLARWPELNNRWHPMVQEMLGRQAPEVIEFIESHKGFKRFESVDAELKELATKKMDIDRRYAKCQRMLRQLENVAYAANLPRVADAAVNDRYAKLLAMESRSFGVSPSAAPVSTSATAGQFPSPKTSGKSYPRSCE